MTKVAAAVQTAVLREKFLAFFESKEHTRVSSSPLVPANDPTLLFTNSGMVQFKDVFLGFDKRPYRRATTAQRCLRAGGKHNDLQNVGYTSRHHTFFEMLGNFSFGDYFKEDAIKFAWEFLTSSDGLNINKKHLWITVFGGGNLFGDNAPSVPADDAAFEFWKQTLIAAGFTAQEAENRITRISTADNFWMMGDTGPCGPCSEIFYDRDIHAAHFRGEDEEYADECVEVWNLVFMEFNRDAAAMLSDLPAPCVDTGMGLERIAAVMQNKTSNYEIDVFEDLLGHVQTVTQSTGDILPSHRVVADHIRAAAYLIADGVLPDNEGRGYVLRKIIRRALMHGSKAAQKVNLGIDPWFYRLTDSLAEIMATAGDVLRDKQQEIEEIIIREEKSFCHNFINGRAHLNKKIHEIKKKLSPVTDADSPTPSLAQHTGLFPGDIAFELYDTYGFPPEATLDEVLSAGFTGINMEVYEKCMNEQRARSRAAMKFNIGQKAANYDGATTEFVGYDCLTSDAQIVALFVNGESVQRADNGDEVLIILNRTPFYAESGGQIGDTGIISANDNHATVRDTQKIRADVRAHTAIIQNGTLAVGDTVQGSVDAARRQQIAQNHSATHLMHAALQRVLGAHVRQKGSLVAPDYLRFDFSHNAPLSDAQWQEIDNIVNEQIRANAEVVVESLKYDDAIARGATALFGEKYGDIVRLVQINPAFSAELCGGTHIRRAGDIGFFQLSAQTAIAAGVRRVEAQTAAAAVIRAQNHAAQLRQIAAIVKSPTEQIVDKISQLQDSLKTAQKQIAALQQQQTAAQAAHWATQTQQINGTNVLITKIANADMKILRDFATTMRAQLSPPMAILLAAEDGAQACFVAAVNGANIHAQEWMQAVAAVAFAKGGGKKEYAQAGGGDIARIDAALAAARAFIQSV